MCIFLTKAVITEEFQNSDVCLQWPHLSSIWTKASRLLHRGRALIVHCPISVSVLQTPLALVGIWLINTLTSTWPGEEAAIAPT